MKLQLSRANLEPGDALLIVSLLEKLTKSKHPIYASKSLAEFRLHLLSLPDYTCLVALFESVDGGEFFDELICYGREDLIKKLGDAVN